MLFLAFPAFNSVEIVEIIVNLLGPFIITLVVVTSFINSTFN